MIQGSSETYRSLHASSLAKPRELVKSRELVKPRELAMAKWSCRTTRVPTGD